MTEFVQVAPDVPALYHPSPPPKRFRLLRQLLPPICRQCRKVLGGQTYLEAASPFLCSNCLIELPWTNPTFHCQQCGSRTAEPERLRCPECVEEIWTLDESRSGFEYDGQIRHWILQLKFQGREQLAPMLGRLLALSLQGGSWLENYDSLVPIPLHSSRLRKRGFNQSLLLAYHFRKNLGKSAPEIHPDWLRRIRATRPQTELPLAERLVNLDDAFEAPPQVRNQRVLLLDDVMTTGSTLNAAARCLREIGASRVGALVLCRRVWEMVYV